MKKNKTSPILMIVAGVMLAWYFDFGRLFADVASLAESM